MTLNHASTSKPRPIYFSQSSYARSSMQGKWVEIKESQNLSLIIISLITHPLVNKPRAQLCQTALTIPQVRSFPLAGRTLQTIPYLDLSSICGVRQGYSCNPGLEYIQYYDRSFYTDWLGSPPSWRLPPEHEGLSSPQTFS